METKIYAQIYLIIIETYYYLYGKSPTMQTSKNSYKTNHQYPFPN